MEPLELKEEIRSEHLLLRKRVLKRSRHNDRLRVMTSFGLYRYHTATELSQIYTRRIAAPVNFELIFGIKRARYTPGYTCLTIRRRLQQSGLSARRPLRGLPLTHNLRCLRRQWCDERRMWETEWNAVVFTNESRICLRHHGGRIRVRRHRGERMLNSCVMHRHTGPAPGIMIELLPWPARSPEVSPVEHMWPMVAQRLTQITPPAATPDKLWQRGEAALFAVPQEHIQSLFESMPRSVAAVICNNGGYCSY
ncbi:transposable element Tcb1 transposase [Trichonephila clavipes]|nr:transposable element Tcb1 transposase [Trichonephila clavipes]